MDRKFRVMTTLCSSVAGLLASFGLIGWYSDWHRLASFGERLIPMAPVTAIGLLILSPLLAVGTNVPHPRRTTVLFASVAGLVGVAGVWIDIGFLRGSSWAFDSYIVHAPGALGDFTIGRVSPITAFFFFLSSVALVIEILGASTRTRVITVAFSLITLAADTIVLLGYLHHTPLLYGAAIIPMALPTALAFAALNLGLLASTAPESFPWPYLVGSSARAILLRSFLPVSVAVVFGNGLIHKLLPATWNPGLVSATSAVLLGAGLTFVISNIAILIGNRIDRAEQNLADAQMALRHANGELLDAYDRTLEGWAKALDLRDSNTYGHCRRVVELSIRLAYALGVDPEQMIHIRRGAFLHDIGKMGLPDRVLMKPGPLNDEEWSIMRRHPGYAHDWLSPIAYLRPALDIPYCHHEKWNGTGYPRGLKGQDIPLIARLFSVVDIWDALVSERPYHQPWSHERVREHLRSLAGTHLDPTVVDAFLKLDLSTSVASPTEESTSLAA